MTFILSALPFDKDALSPIISLETISYHYGKHHQTYVDNLNKLVVGTEFADKSLSGIVKTADGVIFNNAAQVWNHDFYWQCLMPQSEEIELSSLLVKVLEQNFGSVAAFKEQFTKSALSLFGSGWTWLVQNPDGSLQIVNTSNAGNPLTSDKTPLLTCDVWEHAYYIDYRNARAKYLEAFWQIVNWSFVEKQLTQ